MEQRKEGIGDLFHLETKYRRESMPRGGVNQLHQPAPYKEFPDALKRFPIQAPDAIFHDQQGGKSLWEVIPERRSIREFSRQPITLSDLSQLIWATQGITSEVSGFKFRASPSAGALYPVETYLIVNRVEGIPSGLYHYDVKKTQLILLKGGYFGHSIRNACLDQEMLEEAACVFVWTAIIGRSKWKYRERAYRYVYMDAGHIGQNLYLAATALGLGCCAVGAFFDEEVDRLLGVDGSEEVSVYLGVVGRPR